MKVKLLKNHTHCGVEYAPGTVLDMDESCAAWVIEHQVAVPAEEAAPKKTKKEE